MSDPKTDQARRTIRLHRRTVQCLATHALLLDTLRRKYGDRWEEHDSSSPPSPWALQGQGAAPGRALLPHT